MNAAKNIVIFILIFTVIGWFFGYINLDMETFEGQTYEEQSKILGDQFDATVSKGTNALKNVADTAVEGFNMIASIVKTAFEGLKKIADFFGIDALFENILNPKPGGTSGGGEGGFQGGGGFGGGGGGSW